MLWKSHNQLTTNISLYVRMYRTFIINLLNWWRIIDSFLWLLLSILHKNRIYIYSIITYVHNIQTYIIPIHPLLRFYLRAVDIQLLVQLEWSMSTYLVLRGSSPSTLNFEIFLMTRFVYFSIWSTFLFLRIFADFHGIS